jgi:hypothetical protein
MNTRVRTPGKKSKLRTSEISETLGYDSYKIISDFDSELLRTATPPPRNTNECAKGYKLIKDDTKLRKAELILRVLRYKYEVDIRTLKIIIKAFVPREPGQINDECGELLRQKLLIVIPEADIIAGEIDIDTPEVQANCD